MENRNLPKSKGFFNQLIQFVSSKEVREFLRNLGEIIQEIVLLVKMGTEIVDRITSGINKMITR